MTNENEIEVTISWEPAQFRDVPENDEKTNTNGIYQIYGCHPVYGDNVLLYIGKTKRDLKDRLKEHGILKKPHEWTSDTRNLQVYFGEITPINPNKGEDPALLKRVEGLLIFSHGPAYNSASVNELPEDCQNVRVFNLGDYRRLLPECSGKRWNLDKEFTSEN